MGKNTTRDLSIDILRIIACFMVILIHTSMEGLYAFSLRTYTWTFLNFYDTVGRPSVPLFVMISGSLFLRREHIDIRRLWCKNILHLFVVYIVWCAFYAVMNNGLHKCITDPFSVWEEFTASGPQFHLWYLRMLMNLYAITPLLWLLVRAMDRKIFRYYFLLFFVFGILRSTLSDLPFLPKWILEQINLFVDMDLVRFAGYFILGYYLSAFRVHEKISSKTCLPVYIVTLILAAALNQWISITGNWPSDALYGHFSLPVAIEAISLFLFIRQKNFASLSQSAQRWIVRVSESTLFIYIIHEFILKRLGIHFHFYTTNYNVLFSIPLTAMFIFAVGSFSGMLLKKIPLLNKIV